MNRNDFALVATIAAVLAATVAPVSAQDSQAYKDLLTQQESYRKDHNAKAEGAFLAPNFTSSAPDGSVITREQWLKSLAQRQASKEKLPLSFKPMPPRKIDSVSIQGDEGVVMISSVAIYTMKDTNGSDGPVGQDHEWNITQTNRYTWTRTPQGWKLSNMANVAVKVLVDGKPYPPTQPKTTPQITVPKLP